MKFKKIVSKDNSFVSRENNGTLWFSCGSNSVISYGCIINGACNIYRISDLKNEYEKYVPVARKILRFADKLSIRKLRIAHTISTMGKYGWVQTMKYGYVPVDKFDYIFKHRKIEKRREHEFVLLKEKDITWRDE